MILALLVSAVAASVAAVWLAWLTRRDLRAAIPERADLERVLRDELALLRRESAEESRGQRQELLQGVNELGRTQSEQARALNEAIVGRLQAFAQQIESFNQRVTQALAQFQVDGRAGREEAASNLQGFATTLAEQLSRLTESNAQRLGEMRTTLESKLKDIQTDNAAKLDEMRRTVDEKLHSALEQRLGESFKLVSDRLEQVHRGLGEMQTLASGVGDLKRVLSNVRSRGILGEVQLGALLEQVLTPEQYAANVATRPGSNERVEFAIRLPQHDGIWLPIDAKFPREDYERLLDAQERADRVAAEDAASALEARIRHEARNIAAKYLAPPHTTDFAILFVPTEGLYAEILRRPGLFEALQRDYRVTVNGPTNLLAFLNSLQMGFRTLTIEKRSSEVWQVLGAVKTEFGKFGDVLDKVSKKLAEAQTHIDQTGVRSRAITRKLRDVEELPGLGTQFALQPPDSESDDDDVPPALQGRAA